LAEKKGILLEGAEALGLTLGAGEQKLFEVYTRELMDWSQRINLTGHRNRENIEIFHFLDSLALFQTGRITPGLSVLDVGSGAGLPGLPLKIMEPTLELVLLDAAEKRSAFLRFMIRSLSIKGAQVVTMRAEEYGKMKEPRFDRILCRAVASIDKVCRWTAPLLRQDGIYLFQKSRSVKDELRRIEKGLLRLGLRVSEVLPLKVPFLPQTRNVVVIEKFGR